MAAESLVRRFAHHGLIPLATKRASFPAWYVLASSWPCLPSTLCFAYSWRPPLRLSAGSATQMHTCAAAMARSRSAGFMSLWPNYRSRIVHSRGRKLLSLMRLRRWDATLEHDLVSSGITLGPKIVDEVIACIPSARLALQFYIWAGEQIGYPSITSRATGDVVQWYANRAGLIPFLKLLQCLHDRHFYPSPARVNILIQGYGWAGMLERAFGLMLQTQSFANDILVKCLLYSAMKEHRYDMICDVYIEIKKHRPCFELFYDELIQGMALADSQKWGEAEILFNLAADSGHVLNNKTINNLIWAMSRAGQHERAYTLLVDTMKKKIRLENETVSAVVRSLCHAKELRRASAIVDEVKQHGVKLPSKVYSTFLQALRDEPGSDQ